MRKIAATYVFPLTRAPIKNGILVCDREGTVVEIIDRQEDFREEAGVEFYSGILVPGFLRLSKLVDCDHVFFRKMWVTGIALLIDMENQTIAELQKDDFQIRKPDALRRSKEFTPEIYSQEIPISERLLEMQHQNAGMELTDMISRFSIQPATDLGMDAQYGSFTPGARPGVNLLTGIDFKKMKLTSKVKVKRLL